MKKPKRTAASNRSASGVNVYRDLGYADADEILVKAQLVTKIREILRDRDLTQMAAARILGLPQSKLSGFLRGQFRGVSVWEKIEALGIREPDVAAALKWARRKRAR